MKPIYKASHKKFKCKKYVDFMSISLHCLGASNEVGRSAFVIETDKRILLDCGVKLFNETGKPVYPVGIENIKLDSAFISHAHLDHSGFVPNLYKFSKIPWYGTPPTYDVADVLWKDSMKIQGKELPWKNSHYKKALKYWQPMMYKHKVGVGKTDFEFIDAGHIIGAAMINIQYNGKKILYTGDFKFEKTRLHNSGKPMKEKLDALIIESTYADREHPNRNALEMKFANEIRETVREGGTVLCPAFAVGRSQELIRIVRSHCKDVPIYLDGMSKEITKIYLKYQKYLHEYEKFAKDLDTITFVEDIRDKKNATAGGNVIISTAGMLEGGPAINYIKYLNKSSKIIFTGYCMEGTNGWLLQNNNQIKLNKNVLDVDLPVEYLDFSAHAGRNDLFKVIDETNPEKIVCVHGDKEKIEKFAAELKENGYDAIAPKIGDRIKIF